MTSPPCGPAPWDVIARARDRARPSSWRRTLLSAPGQPQGLHVDSDALLASFTGLDAQAAQWLKEQDVDVRELDLVCVHQPSQPFVDAFRARMDIDPAQIIPTFPHTGNAAAATLPLQLAQAVRDRRLAPGDAVALFGLASGASGAVMLLRW